MLCIFHFPRRVDGILFVLWEILSIELDAEFKTNKHL